MVVRQKRNFGLRQEADVNEVSVRFTPRPMSTGQRNKGIELLPPFESRHYNIVVRFIPRPFRVYAVT